MTEPTNTPTPGAQPNAAAVQDANQPTPAAAPAAAASNVQPAAPAAPATPSAEPSAPVVPEKYEFKAPDGVALDTGLLGEFEGIAREFKLPQDQAQKVVDLGAKMAAKFAAQQQDAVAQVSQEWEQAAQADKEFGGDKLPENLALARKALDTFGTPELREMLEQTRLGNNPEVIRFMVRAGKAISPDRLVTGNPGPSASAQGLAQKMFPNMNP